MSRFAVLLAVVALGFASRLNAAPPNVVVILTDDQGWGDLSLHGNPDLRTPHIDSLATGGARFARFCVQPVCSPTRAEFLTGRYHPRGGVWNVSTGGERLNLDEKTIADCFKAAGYATGCFGKWHNGSQYPYHPLGRGFDEFYGFTSGHWGDYFDPPLDHNGAPVRGKGFIADDLTDRTIGFIDRQKGKPFFAYLAYNTPHSPMQVPDADWERFKTKPLTVGPTPPGKMDIGHTRAAYAMVENLDRNIGRLLAALDERQLAKDTIVVYFHDNGPNGRRFNGGLKGAKASTDDGGVRSPLFVRWPGHIPAGWTTEAVAGAIDILPTLTELAGVKRVGDKRLDGISFARDVLATKYIPPDRVLIQHWNRKVSARDRRFRLDDAGKLFDLDADPGQTKDVSAAEPAALARLKEAVAEYRADVLTSLPAKDERPFPVGHVKMPRAELPARDGVPHGTVQRSARAPNCSYFTGWSKPDDRITWNVEVATAGRYRVEVLHTCAKENVGTAVRFRLGEATLTTKVTAAHDPPAYGADHDRVPRVGESLVKDFRPLLLGETTLTAGRAEMTLTAPEIPGKQSIEVRSVVLTLLP